MKPKRIKSIHKLECSLSGNNSIKQVLGSQNYPTSAVGDEGFHSIIHVTNKEAYFSDSFSVRDYNLRTPSPSLSFFSHCM